MTKQCVIKNWILNVYASMQKNLYKKFAYYINFLRMLEHKLLLLILSTLGTCLINIGFNVNNTSLNSLLINMGSGIESSIIFYILVVAFPTYHKNRKVSKSIYYSIHNLSYFPPTFIELIKIANRKEPSLELDINKHLTDNKIDQLCMTVFTLDEIQFNIIRNGQFQPVQIYVLDYIESELKKTKDEIQNILSGLSSFLDDNLMVYLNELYYDTEISAMTPSNFNLLKQIPNQNIQGFKSILKTLYKWSNKIKEHNIKYYKPE